MLGGIDSKGIIILIGGKGAVYSYDPVGSFEKECYRAGGSSASLIQPFLDSEIGCKNKTWINNTISLERAKSICVDTFNAAAERDIYTGDSLSIWIISADGIESSNYSLRKD